MKKFYFLSILTIIVLASCKKGGSEISYDTNIKTKVVVEFDNVAGKNDLELNTTDYTNATGETFKISLFKYFVSNFKLTRADGIEYVVPQNNCYFLTDESKPASLKPVLEIPEGQYTKLSFVLGVDSLRNTKDVSERTGNLDVAGTASGMYWTWNSGYIFFKLEGNSTVSTQSDKNFKYHIGLFGGMDKPTLNNIKTINIDLASEGVLKAKYGRNLSIKLKADALKMFDGTTNVSIASNSVVMGNAFSATVANNYANMFFHDATMN